MKLKTSTFVYIMSAIGTYSNFYIFNNLMFSVAWLLLMTYTLGYIHKEEGFYNMFKKIRKDAKDVKMRK